MAYLLPDFVDFRLFDFVAFLASVASGQLWLYGMCFFVAFTWSDRLTGHGFLASVVFDSENSSLPSFVAR